MTRTRSATGHRARAARPANGLLLVCLAGLIRGTIGAGVRLVHTWSGFGALTISGYRAAVALVVLLGAALVTRRFTATWSLARGHWRLVLLAGVLTATSQLLFFVAVVAIGVSIATVVCLGFAPLLLLVIESVRQRRAPSAGPALTVAMAVVGLVLVSLAGGGTADAASEPVLGTVAALGAGGAYALSAESARALTQRLDTFTVTTATMTVAAALLVPAGLLTTAFQGGPMVTGDSRAWLAIVFLGAVTMVVAYAVFYRGLRSTSSGAAVVATLLEPLVAVLIAVAFLDERLTLLGVVGCLLILVAIGSLGRQPTSVPPPPQ